MQEEVHAVISNSHMISFGEDTYWAYDKTKEILPSKEERNELSLEI